MALNVVTKDSPTPATPAQPAAPQSARDRAIAAMLGTNQPVQNPTHVSPEEMGAIKPKESEEVEASAHTGEPQTHTTEETASAEAPKEDTPAPEADKPALSQQYAQLAKQEKALRAAKLQLKAQQDAFKAQQEAFKASQAPQSPAVDRTKYVDREQLVSDPLSVLTELGISYEQLTQQALNAPSHEQIELKRTISKLEEKIQALEQGQETTKKTFEESKTQAYQQAVNQIRNEAKALVESDENFETVKATNSVDDVVALIEKTFQEDGVLMTVEQAAKEIEDYLVEEAYKLSQLKKIQNRLKPAAPTPAPVRVETAPKAEQKPQEPKQPQQPKTLTNAISPAQKLSAVQRAKLAAQYGPNWRDKVGT